MTSMRFGCVLALLVTACSGQGSGPRSSGSTGTSGGAGGGGSGGSGTTSSTSPDSSGGSTSSGSAGGAGAKPNLGCDHLVCEDFESGAIDAALWGEQDFDDGNSVTVQTDRVAHGSYAAKFHFIPDTGHASLLAHGLPDALAAHLFGRMYLFIDASAFSGHSAFVTIGQTDGYPWSDNHLEFGPTLEGTLYGLHWGGPEPESGSGGQKLLPTGKWTCVEWEFNDVPDAINIWVDGKAALALTSDDFSSPSGLVGGFQTLGLGFRSWHPRKRRRTSITTTSR